MPARPAEDALAMQAVFRSEAVPVLLRLLNVAVGPLLLALLEPEEWARRRRGGP